MGIEITYVKAGKITTFVEHTFHSCHIARIEITYIETDEIATS